MEQQANRLLARQPTLFHLSADGSCALTLELAEGNDAEILVETSAPRIEFVVVAPDGHRLQTAHVEYPQWLAISFPFAGRGQYRILGQAKPAPNGLGGIAFRAAFLPFPATGASSRTKAEALFASAQALFHSPHAADLRQAIAQFRQAGAAWAAAGDREGQVLALAGQSQAWLGLSEYDQATAALYHAAGAVLPTPFWAAWLENLQAQVFLDRWDIGPAMKSAEKASRLAGGLQDEWLTADALADRGESEFYIHSPAAKTDIEESLRLAGESHAIRTMARALRCSGWIEKDQGHLTRAFAQLDRAREYFQKAGDVRAEMQAMSTLATIESISGDLYSTLLRHEQLAALMRGTGSTAHYAILLDNIGGDYEELNRIPDAVVYYQQAMAAYKSTHHAGGEAVALFNLCSGEMQENRLRESLRDCRAAIAIVEQFHDPKRLATSIWKLGTVERALGQTSLASESFRRAIELSHRASDPITEANALMDWGDTLESLGKRDEARRLFEKALPLSQAAEDVPLQLESRYRMARADFEAGRDEEAKSHLKIALNSIEALRRSVGNADLQASYFAHVRKCNELYVEILMYQHERNPSSGAAAEALGVSESGRALTLLDALASGEGAPATPRQAAVSQQFIELHMAVERAYDQRLKLMIAGARTHELDANATALTQAVDTLERAEDEQNATTKLPARAGRTLSTAEIIASSEHDPATLVEFALGADHSYVWVIDEGKVESHILPARVPIASAVKLWRTLATARISRPGESFEDHLRRVEAADRELPRVAADLSCMLLGPFLRPGMDHMVIVPDGELYMLPFAALPENGCQDGGEPLGAKRQVVLTPSLSVLFAPHELARQMAFRGDVALLADPVFDGNDPRVHRTEDASDGSNLSSFRPALPRLIGTRAEAKAIAALFGPERAALYLDFNASLQTLLSPSLSEYRVLHLATHGVLDEGVPGFSGIVLSLVGQDGQPVFGYLKTLDIARLDLRSDLVVLSSCDSAAGVNLSGEGVTGLNHAFLTAGAKRVVSALWSVDDNTSRELMTAFYSGMLRDGLDAPEALRRSQMKIMRNSRTAAPFYWAGFTITSTIERQSREPHEVVIPSIVSASPTHQIRTR